MQIVYLHGLITKNDCELIFSAPDYAQTSTSHWFAFENFSREFLNGRFLFVGTKLKEPDFEFYIRRRMSAEYDEPIYPSIIVDPSLTETLAEFFSSKKIHCIKMPGEHFFHELNKLLPNRKPNLRNSTGVSFEKMNADEKKTHNSFCDSFNELPEELASTFTSVYDDFFSGGELTILDLESENDCLFTHTEKALNAAQEWFALPNAETSFIYLHGGGGCGKSSSLKRIAFNLSQLSKNVYWHNSLGWPYNATNLARILPAKSILIIDDVQNFDRNLPPLLEAFKKANKPLLVIAASRDRYEPRISANVYPIITKNFIKIENNWLAEDDLDRLAKHLVKKERLGPYLRGKNVDEIKNYLRDETSKILLAAMIKVFAGRSHEEIVVDEFQQLSELGKSIYKYTALVESRSNKILLTTLSKACSSKNTHVISRVLGNDGSLEQHELKSLIFQDEVNGNIFLRTRHRIIASTLVKKVINNDEALEMVKTILKSIAPSCNRESSSRKDMFYRLAKSLMDQHWLADELNIDPLSLTVFYAEIQKDWEWNFHYWIQRATLELHKMRRFNIAWDYCSKGIEIGNKSPTCLLTHANICFHWAKSLDVYSGRAEELHEEAMNNLDYIYQQGYREPIFYFIIIRGLFHLASKFNRFKELDPVIDHWIKEASIISSTTKMVAFLQTARTIHTTSKARIASGHTIDVSPIDTHTTYR